ncbi:MAG: hypothetical protein IKS55_12545 [Oscillospiraceae bacterium]|nr:hypothetical protein [Oscillospiraceae bacterium]
MIDFETAKKIGIQACVDKIGIDYVRKYRDTYTTAYGMDTETDAFCYVGVSDDPIEAASGNGIILEKSPFPYYASCNVNLNNGQVSFLECRTPYEVAAKESHEQQE